jgi:NADH-quinone oxidoreductase subunit N
MMIIVELSDYNFNLLYKSNILEFYFFLANAVFFFTILIKSISLITIFICIIGFSISSYLIIMTNLTSILAREAAVKYYYLSVLSSMLLALGILLLFVQFGTTNLLEIDKILYYSIEFSS